MKKISTALMLLIFSNAYSQWTVVPAPAGTLNLYSVFAITDSALAIAGDNKVIRSINAGATWTTPLTITGAYIYEVHTAEPTHWYALTANTTWWIKLGNPNGITASTGKPDSILSLHFMTPGCGIAVGYTGKIEATCDTGATWQLRSSGTLFNLNAVWFADAATGCACGDFGAITCTQNSGATWGIVSSTVAQSLNAIHFPTATVGYIAGNAGTFLKSTDAGATWNSMPVGVPNNLNGVFFIDVDTGYVVGSAGLIMKTIDGGTTWNTMTSPTNQTLNSVHFVSPTVGWAVGNFATILKYGDFSTEISEENSGWSFSVYPNPAKSELRIQNSECRIECINIYDVFGKKVFEKLLLSDMQHPTIDVSNLSPGIYFLQLSSGSSITTQKIIVQR